MQAASVLIKPTTDVVTIQVVNDMPSQAMPEGILVELGDFYSSEHRKVLVTFGVPAMAVIAMAVASFFMGLTPLADAEKHPARGMIGQVKLWSFAGKVPVIQEPSSGKVGSPRLLRP